MFIGRLITGLVTGLLLLSVVLLAPPVSADEPIELDRFGEVAVGESERLETYKAPHYTQDASGDWVAYVFTEESDHYRVQAARASIKLFDYYTEVWNEDFDEVIVYNDWWAVEHLNKQGKWVDAGCWGITRSYEIIDDGIRVKRTGNTDIGQREDIYTFRAGEPCKIEIRQTCDDAQTVRYVWQLSGVVATDELPEYAVESGKQKGLAYYDGGDFVARLRWFGELDTCDYINPVCESHAQGRKATIYFGNFDVGAGGTSVLDPMYEYYNTGDDDQISYYNARLGCQTFTTTGAYLITSVKLKIYKWGSPGVITVEIQGTSAEKPDDSALCSGTTDANTLTSSAPGEWREITFGAGAELSATTKYAIVMKNPGNSSNRIQVRWDSSSPSYAGGSEGYDEGGGWVLRTAYDWMFECWGEAIPVVAPTNFALTQVGTNNVGITWTMGGGANTTVIRASIEGYPASPIDDYAVCNVTGESYIDRGVNLTLYSYYYRAWSWGDSANYSDDYAEGKIGGASMILLALAIIPLGLTVAMFATRNSMLGFPCALFWAIFGGYCYLQSEIPWGDIYFYLAFGSLMGMTVFTALAAFGLRERRNAIADEEMEKGEGRYVDEGKSEDEFGTTPSGRTRALRARAEARRKKRQ